MKTATGIIMAVLLMCPAMAIAETDPVKELLEAIRDEREAKQRSLQMQMDSLRREMQLQQMRLQPDELSMDALYRRQREEQEYQQRQYDRLYRQPQVCVTQQVGYQVYLICP